MKTVFYSFFIFCYFVFPPFTFFSLQSLFPASEKGIVGNSISLVDGTLITDAECISFYAKENNVFVISLLEVVGVTDIGSEEIEFKYVENEVPKKVVVPNKSKAVEVVTVPQIMEVVEEEANNPDAISLADKSVGKGNVDLLVNNFPIKLENFSIKIQEKIKNEVRLTNSEKSQLIQRVVDDLQKMYGSNPVSFVIEGVAKKLLFAFPILCQVDDEGNKIGNGEFTTIRQIKDRLYYLNNSKDPKRKPVLSSTSASTSASTSLKRKPTHSGPILEVVFFNFPNIPLLLKLS